MHRGTLVFIALHKEPTVRSARKGKQRPRRHEHKHDLVCFTHCLFSRQRCHQQQNVFFLFFLSRTDQRPLPGADAHAVGGAGRELGPVGQLTVVLAGQLTPLADGGHGLGELQALIDVGLRPIQLAARHGCKNQRQKQERKAFFRKCLLSFICPSRSQSKTSQTVMCGR